MTDKKEYTEMQQAFLEFLTGEARGDIRTAMRLAGYSDATRTAEVVGPLKDEIVERASMMLAMNTPKATYGILNVLDDPSSLGARNAVAAAREILDRAGIVKKEKIEVSGAESGIFILPPKQVADLTDDNTN
jgi:hypothetical protein